MLTYLFYKLCYFQAMKETGTEDGMLEASCVSDEDWDSFSAAEVEEGIETSVREFSTVIGLNFISLS